MAHVSRFYVFTWELVFIVATFGFGMVMGNVASCYKWRYAALIHTLSIADYEEVAKVLILMVYSARVPL
jgi:hypothetical protein